MDAAQIFQMMTEFMTENAPEEVPGFCGVCIRVNPVKGSLEHHNLSDAGIDLILSQCIQVVSPGILWDNSRF